MVSFRGGVNRKLFKINPVKSWHTVWLRVLRQVARLSGLKNHRGHPVKKQGPNPTSRIRQGSANRVTEPVVFCGSSNGRWIRAPTLCP
jgi:hypothetical protein